MMMMISPVLFPLYNLETRIICARLNIASHKAILLLQSGDGHNYLYDDDDDVVDNYNRFSQDNQPTRDLSL